MASRLIGFSLLLAAAACSSANRPMTQATFTPRNGPRARVFVEYFGAYTNRTVRTRFTTDRSANVLVGRLSGDGRIEILFPETPQGSTRIQGSKTYSAKPFLAVADVAPHLYAYAAAPMRSMSARRDSYDGGGNGYVFIIATDQPMFTEALDDHGFWTDSLEVDDYYTSYDPREAILGLADVLTRGMPYSLDYANNLSSMAYGSYASSAMNCSLLGPRGYTSLANHYGGGWIPALGWWFGSFGGFDSFAWQFSMPMFGSYSYSPMSSCGLYPSGRYGSWYSPSVRGTGFPPTGRGTDTVSSTPVTKAGFAAGTRRPGYRPSDEGIAGINLSRPRFGGSGTKPGGAPSTSTMDATRPRLDGHRDKPVQNWAPPIRETAADRYDRAERSNSGVTRSGAIGGTHTEGVTHTSAPTPIVREAPVAREAPAGRAEGGVAAHKVESPPAKPKDP